jgi:hypothetical protein
MIYTSIDFKRYNEDQHDSYALEMFRGGPKFIVSGIEPTTSAARFANTLTSKDIEQGKCYNAYFASGNRKAANSDKLYPSLHVMDDRIIKKGEEIFVYYEDEYKIAGIQSAEYC